MESTIAQPVAVTETPEELLQRVESLIGDWSTEIDQSKNRVSLRLVDIDLKELKTKGKVLDDEFFIPDRIVEGNIRREQPQFVSFLEGSEYLIYFKDRNDPALDTLRLSEEVTLGLKYPDWFKPFFRTIDGAQTHGTDSMEVVFDIDKPLHIGFEHVGHENLFYDRNGKNIQDQDILIRSYDISVFSFLLLAEKRGFDPEKVGSIRDKYKGKSTQDFIKIYKVFTKDSSGNVLLGWYCNEVGGAKGWMKVPESYMIGILSKDPVGNIVNEPLKIYPIFLYIYSEDCQQKLAEKVGRCFLDEYEQEAATAITSAHITKLHRSAQVYASPDGASDVESDIRRLDVEIKPGQIYNKKMLFWSPDAPDPTNLQSLQYIHTNKAQQIGQTDYAVMSRKDSRKSATEMMAAQQDAAQIKGIALGNYSGHLSELFAFVWKIVRAQAVNGILKLCQVQVEQMTPQVTLGTETSQKVVTNDLNLIDRDYLVVPGGVEMQNREKLLAQMMQDWPVVSMTALKNQFLEDFISLRYPKQSNLYVEILKQGDIGKLLVKSLMTIVSGQIQAAPELYGGQEQGQLQTLMQQCQAYLSS